MLSNLSRRRVMVLVVVTCLLLITLDKRGNPVIDKLRSAFDRITRPVDIATEALVLPLERAWYGITNYEDLENENARLRDQIEQMKGSDIEARTAILQYRELLQQTQLTSKWSYDHVTGEVVGVSPSNFQQTVEISVGSNRGIQVGMPVIDGAGLVGKITRVFPNRSIVLLITDPDYAITARVLGTATGEDITDGLGGTTDPGTTSTTAAVTEDTSAIITGSITPGTGVEVVVTESTEGSTTSSAPLVLRETGALEGQGPNQPMVMRFSDLTSSITSVQVGAIVDTAGGTDSLAPQGIPIGRITAVLEQTGTSSALVEVTPSADLRRLSFLTVLLFLPNQQAVLR